MLRDFENLETVDLLVPGDLKECVSYIDGTDFGSCEKKNARIVSIDTREWTNGLDCLMGYVNRPKWEDLGGNKESVVEKT
ncbi:hypothetical protein WAI453_000586 [Rhynchosporium graminicola]